MPIFIFFFSVLRKILRYWNLIFDFSRNLSSQGRVWFWIWNHGSKLIRSIILHHSCASIKSQLDSLVSFDRKSKCSGTIKETNTTYKIWSPKFGVNEMWKMSNNRIFRLYLLHFLVAGCWQIIWLPFHLLWYYFTNNNAEKDCGKVKL